MQKDLYFVSRKGEKRLEQCDVQILNRGENCASTFIGQKTGELYIVMAKDFEERVKYTKGWKKPKEK